MSFGAMYTWRSPSGSVEHHMVQTSTDAWFLREVLLPEIEERRLG